MHVPQWIRRFLPLVIGLVIGGVGATLFLESMPGADGSPEERAHKLEHDLKQAQNRIAALESANSEEMRRPRLFQKSETAPSSAGGQKTLADGARSIAEDLREGKPVNPEDIFRASKPLLRDLAPLFDRVRVQQQKEIIDATTGELARKYDLTAQQQESLKQWFKQKTEVEGKRWSEMIGRDGTRLEDIIRATRDVRPDEGLDDFMGSVLSGDKLVAFRADRLTERAARIEQQADMKVQRLDSIVGLDEAQRDQVFGVMARTSRDYDPSMVLEGAEGEIGPTPIAHRQAALLAVLRPDQRAAYEAERQRRRDEATKAMEGIGLTLPPDWEMLDERDFE